VPDRHQGVASIVDTAPTFPLKRAEAAPRRKIYFLCQEIARMQLASAALQENKSAPICGIFKAKKSTCSKQVTVGRHTKVQFRRQRIGATRPQRFFEFARAGPNALHWGCALIEEWRIVNPLG
jgi:hypothetical protein